MVTLVTLVTFLPTTVTTVGPPARPPWSWSEGGYGGELTNDQRGAPEAFGELARNRALARSRRTACAVPVGQLPNSGLRSRGCAVRRSRLPALAAVTGRFAPRRHTPRSMP